MITKITEPTFKTSDGQKFENLALAQEHEIKLLLSDPSVSDAMSEKTFTGEHWLEYACKKLVTESARVLDILSTRANSGAKARTINGAPRKKRTPKATDTAANLALK